MVYAEAVDYIDRLKSERHIALGLDDLREVLGLLGDPQQGPGFVHIAGTNGKGSVAAFVSQILIEAGYRVGQFTSPAVFEYREIIRVNGTPICEKDLAACVARVRDANERLLATGHAGASAFETETAAAFLYFKDKGCDIVVLETGMGGADDATNIVENTLCSVITTVSLDHMKYLGDTAADIARVKAGIIKPGRPVLLGSAPEEARRVIEEVCSKNGSKLLSTDLAALDVKEEGLCGARFDYGRYKDLKICAAGHFQPANACTAVEVIEILNDLGYYIEDEAVRAGLWNARIPGRFELISRDPAVIIDGAHNPEAAAMLRKSTHLVLKGRRVIYIMGVLKDKDYRSVIRETAGAAERIFTVTPDNHRALDGAALAQAIREEAAAAGFCGTVTACESFYEAAGKAIIVAGNDAVIIAFGSLSYLSDIKRAIEENINGRR